MLFHAINAATVARRRRRTGFGDELCHHIVVPPGPEGRPGERLLSWSRSVIEPRPVAGGRLDMLLLLGPRGSQLVTFCFDRSDLGETAEHATWKFLSTIAERGSRSTDGVRVDDIGGRPAYRCRFLTRTAQIVEWRVDVDRWLFVIGAQTLRGDDETGVLDRAEAALATWRWIPAARAAAPALPAF